MLCTDRFQDQALRFQAQVYLHLRRAFQHHITALRFQLYASSSSTLLQMTYVYSGGR